MKTDYKKLIVSKLKRSGKKPVRYKELLRDCKRKHFDMDKFNDTVASMKRTGEITETKYGFSLGEKRKERSCKVVRINRTFGFVQDIETGVDYFVAGKYLMGAMPGDIVKVRVFKGKGESLEGEVTAVEQENYSRFMGEIVNEFGQLRIVPDTMCKSSMSFDNPQGLELHEGDKVIAEITHRGKRHSEHSCVITASYGSSMRASSCALCVVEINGLTPVFPPQVIMEARNVSDYSRIDKEIPKRLDLRDLPIFTIDGADTKDIDDAISVTRTKNGYELGVHIADVSHYVLPKSELDNEAFKRGTSVYYANRVIPMLPKELSNGICSLNPGEDRLAFSCIAQLDKQGHITSYKFAKTVIRSRVKGVYSEINEMLEGYNSRSNSVKYEQVADQLPVMLELADILKATRLERGCPELETAEGKLIIDENDRCVDVVPRTRGRSEEMIEDFMLVANECAARFGFDKKLPFVYRIHEEPSEEKTEGFKQALVQLNIQYKIGQHTTPGDIAAILKQVKDTPLAPIVNSIALRSMSKAKYSTEPVGHFGLVLDDYAHFTSPIRRYPDLAIHRIMSDYLSGEKTEDIARKYSKFSYAAADQATKTEITAMEVERSCEDCYKAEYMLGHVNEEFDGIITGVTDFGVFVGLENTCEGLLHIDQMQEGLYKSDEMISLKNYSTGQTYTLGDKIRVKVMGSNVNSGKIDFTLADE
ncbi:MAG: ribonuclease R [Ruminococcus sp.]|nr:ribonuclease R [Ruminococcus sp.]